MLSNPERERIEASFAYLQKSFLPYKQRFDGRRHLNGDDLTLIDAVGDFLESVSSGRVAVLEVLRQVVQPPHAGPYAETRGASDEF